MSTTRLALLTLLVSLAQACTSSAARQQVAPPEPAARAYPEYKGPRLRVSIVGITDEEPNKPQLEQLGWRDIAPVLEEQIITELVRTGRVTVLERKQLKKVAGEIDLGRGEMADYFAKSEKPEKGKFLTAQAVFTGAVTEFEPDAEGLSAGVAAAGIGASVGTKTARVGLELRLVDVESGAVLEAAHAAGTATRTEVEAGITYLGLKIGGGGYYKTPLGRATREALDKAVEFILEKLGPIAWEAHIASVEGPSRVIIKGGADINLKVGDRFDVIAHVKELLDPNTGASLGFVDAPFGKITLSDVQPEVSIGSMDNGKVPPLDAVIRERGAESTSGPAARLVATTGEARRGGDAAAVARGNGPSTAVTGGAAALATPKALEVPTYVDVTPLPELAGRAAPRAEEGALAAKQTPVGASGANTIPASVLAGGQPAARFGKGRIELLRSVEFEFSSAALTAAAARLLDQVAYLVGSRPDMGPLRIVGHTDNVGDVRTNLRLSEARAKAVRNYLAARGVPRERLQATGFGDQKPLGDNATEAGRAKNRRVEFIFGK